VRKTNANINSTTKAHTNIKQNMNKVTHLKTAIMTKAIIQPAPSQCQQAVEGQIYGGTM